MSDPVPICVCTGHPKGESREKYMFVAECTNDFVVFCCKRCSEIMHEAVIQVRTLKPGKDKAKYVVDSQRRHMDPRLLQMLQARKRGGVRVREMEEA